MKGHRFLAIAVMVGVLGGVLAGLVSFSWAMPAMAASNVTGPKTSRFQAGAEPLSAMAAQPAEKTSQILPPAAPGSRPLLQGTLTVTADLTISKIDSSDPVTAGTSLSYILVVTNLGPSDALSVTMTDTLPAQVSFASATPSQGNCTGTSSISCDLGDIPNGGTVMTTILVDVDPSARGQITNTGAVSSTTFDPNSGNNSATVFTTVTTEADLSLTKSDSQDPVLAGGSFNYDITVTNNGPSSATGVTIVDTLPSGFTFSSGSGCTAAGQQVTCTISGSLAKDAQTTRTIAVNVSASLAHGAQFTNTATVSGNEADLNQSNNSDQEETTVNRQADLAVVKSGTSNPVVAGTSFSYNIQVTNNGPSDASGMIVSDNLPTGLTFKSAGSSPECSASGQQVTCTIVNLAPSHSAVRTIAVTVDAWLAHGASLANTASVLGNEDDPVPGNDSDTESTGVIRRADLAVTQSDAPDPVRISGRTVQYTLVVANSGPSDATAVVLTDTLPSGWSFQSANPSICNASSGRVICDVGPLARGADTQVILNVETQGKGVFTNRVVVGSSDEDPDPADNSDTETTMVQPVDLSVTKSAPGTALIGEPLTYTITVFNAGCLDCNPATGVILTDTLPANVQFVSASPGCSRTGSLVVCIHGTLDQNRSAVYTIVVTPITLGQIVNSVTVAADEPELDPTDNTDSAVTNVSPVADLQVSKTGPTSPVLAGGSFNYDITVTNNGPSSATGVRIVDTLPSGFTFRSNGSSNGCTAAGQQVTCTISGSLAKDAQTTRTIAVNVSASVAHGARLTNTATVSGNEADLNQSNNSDQEETTVNRQADLRVTKSEARDPMIAGRPFSYTIQVNNLGPSYASGVMVRDTLPAGLTFDSTGSSGQCSSADGQQVICNVSELPPGSSPVTWIVGVNVDASLPDDTQLSNTATVSGNEYDPGNNSGSELTGVVRRVDLEVSQVGSPAPVLPGRPLTYGITVTNHGPSLASGVAVTDILPVGTTLISATASQGSCSGSGTINCSLGTLGASSSAQITIAVSVDSQANGTLSNSASVDSIEDDTNAVNNVTVEETMVGEFYKTFLPIVLKPALTQLSVFNDNTGGNVTFTVLGTDVSCVVPNNTTKFCGSFPAGTYQVQVKSACGDGVFTKEYPGGPVTTRVFCQ